MGRAESSCSTIPCRFHSTSTSFPLPSLTRSQQVAERSTNRKGKKGRGRFGRRDSLRRYTWETESRSRIDTYLVTESTKRVYAFYGLGTSFEHQKVPVCLSCPVILPLLMRRGGSSSLIPSLAAHFINRSSNTRSIIVDWEVNGRDHSIANTREERREYWHPFKRDTGINGKFTGTRRGDKYPPLRPSDTQKKKVYDYIDEERKQEGINHIYACEEWLEKVKL